MGREHFLMSSKKRQELWFILISTIITLIAVYFITGCAHVKEKEYFESGQLKKDSERYGILFSEGKEFSLIEIN